MRVGSTSRIWREATVGLTRQGSGPRLRHVPALDGLRGIAVAGVVAFHAESLTGGYLGVDLFFVLSGYLITSLLLVEFQGTGAIRLLAFWARRARRLLPALFGVLVGVALYAAFVAAPSELSQIRGDALATLGYVANWRAIIAGNSYWAQFIARSPLEHTWSLAIEEQFYLIWPLIVLGVLTWRRGSARALLAVAAALAIASAVWMAVRYTPGSDPTRVYFGTDTRAPAVLLGATLAAWLVWRGPVTTRSARVGLEVVAVFAALGVAWAWLRVDGRTDSLYAGGFFVIELGVVAVIAAVSHPRPGPLAAVFSFGPLRALGIISYGVYLWHWPIFVALSPERAGLDGLRLNSLRVGCTLLVAIASYFALERPIRRGSFSVPAMRIVVPVAVAAVIITVLVSTLGAAPLARFQRDPIPSHPAASGTVRVLVVGDSVGASVAGVMKAADRYGKTEVINRAIAGCTLVDLGTKTYDLANRPIDAQPCSGSWPSDVAAAQPDVVLVSMSGDFGPGELTPCDPRWDRAYRRSLSDAVSLFQQWDARVALNTSVYPTRAIVPIALARQRIDCVNRITRRVVRVSHAQLVDLQTHLCPGGKCPETNAASEALRPDSVHFEPAAAEPVGRWLLQRVAGDAGAAAPRTSRP